MDRHKGTRLENEQNFIAGGASLKCGADVPAGAVRIQISAGRVDRQARSTRPVLRGKTAELHGLVVIFAQAAAHAGSHSRICASAASQGPVSGIWSFVIVVSSQMRTRG